MEAVSSGLGEPASDVFARRVIIKAGVRWGDGPLRAVGRYAGRYFFALFHPRNLDSAVCG